MRGVWSVERGAWTRSLDHAHTSDGKLSFEEFTNMVSSTDIVK